MAGPMMNKTYSARNGARNAIAGREWSLNFLELLVAAGVRWVMRVAVSVDTDDLPSWVEQPGSSRPGRRLDRLAVCCGSRWATQCQRAFGACCASARGRPGEFADLTGQCQWRIP